jgi:hypothetical protein
LPSPWVEVVRQAEVVEGMAGGGEGPVAFDAEVACAHGVGARGCGEPAVLLVVVDLGGWVEDEGAVPASAGHDPVVFQLAVGALDGGGGQAEVGRQLP